MSIRTRTTVLVLSLILPEAVILGSIGYYSILAATRFSDALTEITTSLDGVRRLNMAMAELEETIPTEGPGPSPAAGELQARYEEVERQLDSCSSATCHSSPLEPRQMVARIRPVLERIREDSHRLLQIGGPDPGREEWEAISGDIRGGIDRIEGLNDAMVRALAVRVQDMQTRSRSATQRALWLMIGATLAAGLVGAALTYFTTRALLRPVHTMVEATERIARGDMGAPVPTDRPDELGILARSLHSMAVELDRRQREQADNQSRLEEEIRTRTQELRRMDEALRRSERLATIGLMSAGVAHELNNPLTGLIMSAHLLAESAPPGEPAAELISSLRSSADRCKRVVDQMRAMARHTASPRVPCDLRKILDRALDLAGSHVALRRVRLSRDDAAADSVVPGVEESLLQLVLNLILNGIEAMPEGGRLGLRLLERGGGLVLEVEDEGTGIPPERRAALFHEMFTTKEHGAGVGLMICAQILREHGAVPEVESRTAEEAAASGGNHGTVVRVVFPRSAAAGGTSS